MPLNYDLAKHRSTARRHAQRPPPRAHGGCPLRRRARRQAKQALVVAGRRWRRHARSAAASHVSAAPIGERGLPPAQTVYVVLFGDLFAVGLARPDTLEAADAMRRRRERD